MKIQNILCFLFLITITIALPLTQQEVDTFIRLNNLVPAQVKLETYNIQNDKSIVVYQSQNTKWKFVIGQTLEGKPYVVFRQQMTEIKFNSFGRSSQIGFNQPVMIQQMPMINQMQTVPGMPIMPMMPIPLPAHQQFNQQAMNGGFLNIQQPQAGQPALPGMRRSCRIDEEQVKILLKDSLTIFKDGEIQKIQKVGFQKGTGIILEITLLNDKKSYKVKAGYMPRWGKLSILKLEEIPASTQNKNTALQTGKELIGKIVNDNVPKNPFPKVQEAVLAQKDLFDNLIQTFVEKLLVRKNVQVVPTQIQAEKKQAAIVRPPFLLGSQGEPENVQASQQTHEAIAPKVAEPPLLLGSKDENPFGYQFKAGAQENQEQVGNHHKEENSEQISELVTEVLNKIKLKTK